MPTYDSSYLLLVRRVINVCVMNSAKMFTPLSVVIFAKRFGGVR